MDNGFDAVRGPVLDKDFCEQAMYSSKYLALILVHREREIVPAHWHSGLEINYVVEGSGTVTVDERVEPLKPGKLCISSPYAVHSFVTENRDGRPPLIVSVSFDGERVKQVYGFAERFLLSPDAPGATDEDRGRMISLCLEMLDATSSIAPETPLRINALLYEMLYLAYRRFVVGPRRHPITRNGRNVIQPIIGYLESHHAEPLTSEELARRFGYSREHFSRVFKEGTGIGFKEYLTGLRLEDAYQQLMYRDVRSLSRIAADAGFPSVRIFSTAFRRRYGASPLEYRNAHPR
ncbi:helix-turn-helix domain-containing protein [Bifidobacterium platyrrhinorum]|uniref:Helix-turn-helix domain-containing protein n=1 Tax=Bifidobacterium platyrrhinorum TaxID=2661628 RepID=A0A6L9SQR2_9BIFI|nr:AraC family transcriptional regulator [Bifidobacterium platyrrhinorum]NEG54907.1 helix-turn-helix domain-containing protein [Bifidobacterium platyrrhinorum]